ncbi:HNH endonuclease [Micromonospora peucetia]|uniref:HNH endonuclease n=1 Tax=Micromonospora peucetia TaxID=47871 RepID=UPI00331DA399
MWRLEAPRTAARESFATCIAGVQDEELAERFNGATESIVLADQRFDEVARSATCYLLDKDAVKPAGVERDEMIWLYDVRMAKKRSAGRKIYDEIRTSAPYNRCPLCGQRRVETLDHYLPKTHFPALAVSPRNLIPACSDCNKMKTNRLSSSEEEQTLHPYYDDVGGSTWLYGRVVESEPGFIEFVAEPSPSVGEVMAKRIRHHFEVFQLSSLYASHAAEELCNVSFWLSQLFTEGGKEALRGHLLEQADGRRLSSPNSWQAATYSALAESDWFCSGMLFNARRS